MRVGVSGAHGTGKTTLVQELCGHLAGHLPVDEPYFLLEEEGYEFGFPPSLDDYRAQLRCSLRVLRSAAPRVVFDRTPLDFLAYLAALGASVEDEADPSVVRSALAPPGSADCHAGNACRQNGCCPGPTCPSSGKR